MAIKTVEIVRSIRDKYHEETKNLSPEQQRDFFRRKAEETARRVKGLKISPKGKNTNSRG